MLGTFYSATCLSQSVVVLVIVFSVEVRWASDYECDASCGAGVQCGQVEQGYEAAYLSVSEREEDGQDGR